MKINNIINIAAHLDEYLYLYLIHNIFNCVEMM